MIYHDLGSALGRPYFLALLAEACGQTGQTAAGLAAVTEALSIVQHTEERCYEAELYRCKGELLLQAGVEGLAGDVSNESQTAGPACRGRGVLSQALAIARYQQAKSWELRAAMSLARLWQQQGKRAEASALLAPIYGWFTEGLATADLHEAHTLLTALGG